MSKEKIICTLFQVEPTDANLVKLKKTVNARVYSSRYRDKYRLQRYVTIDEKYSCLDYRIDTHFYDICNVDIHLQKIKYLNKKALHELSTEEVETLHEYICTTRRPVLLMKKWKDTKLLVTEIPQIIPITYSDICETIINSEGLCKYCSCNMKLFDTSYSPTTLSIDAVVAINGHTKDNIVACCRLCNSKKGHQSHTSFGEPMISEPPQE